MAWLLLLLLALVSLAIVPGQTAQSPAELYWKTKLGNVPMPKVVKDSLQSGPQGLPMTATMNDKNNKVSRGVIYAQRLPATVLNNKNNKINGAYAQGNQALEDKVFDNNSNKFFFEKNLIHQGTKMKLHFVTNDDGTKFLPSEVAERIPFSTEKLLEILTLFSVKPNTAIAKTMEETMKICEARSNDGEYKHCTTSLEDMVDYAITKTGQFVKPFSTEINKDAVMEYRIEGAHKISNRDNLVCHKLSYPYAVFYCHSQKKTDTYIVSLVGEDGKKSKAVAVCHKDTSSWNPRHLAFQLLKVKPGKIPICHFLNEITMVWVP